MYLRDIYKNYGKSKIAWTKIEVRHVMVCLEMKEKGFRSPEKLMQTMDSYDADRLYVGTSRKHHLVDPFEAFEVLKELYPKRFEKLRVSGPEDLIGCAEDYWDRYLG